jgi:acetolactate synthase I/III small subunit
MVAKLKPLFPEEASERHTLSILVDNEAGVLGRITGLFSARGYNIESLTVADVSAAGSLNDGAISRITIVTSGPRRVIDQIVAQLDRLVPVHSVTDLSERGPHVERELALVKVAGTGEKRVEALRLADIFRARPVDTTTQSFVFEISGSTQKVDQFIELMREVGLVEVARGGVVALSRGADKQC